MFAVAARLIGLCLMIRWPQIALGLCLAIFGMNDLFAQKQSPRDRDGSAPVADREETRSRFSEMRTATRLPPIVSKAKVTGAEGPESSAAKSRRVFDAPVNAPKVQAPIDAADPRNAKEILQPTTILAVVGGHYILTGDVMGDVNLTLPPEALAAPPEIVEAARMNYLRQFLTFAIETKLLYIDFMRQERASEMMVKIEQQATSRFDEFVADAYAKVIAADSIEAREDLRKLDPAVRRIAELMVREQLSTMGEVDMALGRYGTSLAKERKRYTERLTGFLVMQKVMGINQGPKGGKGGGVGSELTREQLFDYYQDHLVDFARPARCQWEKLSVRQSKFDSQDAAWDAIAAMGNRVRLGGAKLSAVAKQSSHTADASDGGFHDWTGRDSLRSGVLNKAIFTLPVGALSEILEDDEGFHIVRVIERDDGGYQSFSDPKTQEIIRTKMEDARMNEARKEHSAKLKREIAIWNVFDELNEAADGADSDR
jgi:hypothetical protein